MGNPAADGGRWVDVSPERFPGWVDGFVRRHGPVILVSPATATAVTSAETGSAAFALTAADGTVARCHVPFPPMTAAPADSTAAGYARAAAAHAAAPRTVGVLLVRLGGYAAGVFAGSPPVLAASKTGSRLVHGRSAAGGWSQHRFARRREKQAAAALGAAAEAAADVFGPYRDLLDAVVLGGDRRAMAGLRDDPRLRPYLARATGRFLTVPDPRPPVLRDSPRLFRAVRVHLTGPSPDAHTSP